MSLSMRKSAADFFGKGMQIWQAGEALTDTRNANPNVGTESLKILEFLQEETEETENGLQASVDFFSSCSIIGR